MEIIDNLSEIIDNFQNLSINFQKLSIKQIINNFQKLSIIPSHMARVKTAQMKLKIVYLEDRPVWDCIVQGLTVLYIRPTIYVGKKLKLITGSISFTIELSITKYSMI